MFTDEHAGQGFSANTDRRREGTAIDRIPEYKPDESPSGKRHELDNDETLNLWRRMLGYYMTELSRQSDNRTQMEKDENSYDGEQWEEMDKAIVEGRGQMALVYNVIATSINWMLGTERRGRTDYKVLPRRKEGAKAAENKSALLKYLSDVNRTEFSISEAFAECVKAGLGWLECGLQDDAEGEPIYDMAESWRNIVHDSAARKLDVSDGRYIFRTKWTDQDAALAMFPDRREAIINATSTTTDYGYFGGEFDGDNAMDYGEEEMQNTGYIGGPGDHGLFALRKRVRLIEGWFRVPIQEDRMTGGEFSGEIFDPYSDGHIGQIITGKAKVRKRLTWRMHVMIFTNAGPLWFSKSPYRHNHFPFTPVWCYRRAKNGLPYGMIRNLRDLQNDINKRASKALHILSTNKTIMDDDAVVDLDEFREEVSRADAIIVKKRGSQLDLNVDRDLAPAHMDLMRYAVDMVQQMSGVTHENLGRDTNATSGRAIIAKQDQGSLTTSPIFDNLRFARQVHGEKKLSLIEQFMTEEKQFRITNKRGVPTHMVVMDGLPENDIVMTKADYIISEDDWNATIKQSQAQELLDLLQKLAPVAPELVMAVMDLLVEMMDVPQSDELVARIRNFTGMEDPDQDPNEMTPERQAREEAKAAQAEMEKRAADAQLATVEATAAEKMAKAEKTAAEIGKVVTDTRRAEADLPQAELDIADKAFKIALDALATPTAVDVADALADEARAASAPQPQQQPQPV